MESDHDVAKSSREGPRVYSPARGEAGLRHLVEPLAVIRFLEPGDVAPLLERIAKIFCVSSPWLEFSTRGRAFGHYDYAARRIVLAPRGRELATLLHEFAHHVVAERAQRRGFGPARPHGKEFGRGPHCRHWPREVHILWVEIIG